jgi:hypothetical protein
MLDHLSEQFNHMQLSILSWLLEGFKLIHLSFNFIFAERANLEGKKLLNKFLKKLF